MLFTLASVHTCRASCRRTLLVSWGLRLQPTATSDRPRSAAPTRALLSSQVRLVSVSDSSSGGPSSMSQGILLLLEAASQSFIIIHPILLICNMMQCIFAVRRKEGGKSTLSGVMTGASVPNSSLGLFAVVMWCRRCQTLPQWLRL